WFQPTEHTRGPWDAANCHAGPPTGLIARAVEILLPEQRLTRLTVNLYRPVPFDGFSIEAKITRQGRTVCTAAARVLDKHGKEVVNATSMHLSPAEPQVLATQRRSIGSPENAVDGAFPLRKTLHGLPAFNGEGVQVRYPTGHTGEPGPTVAWMRTVPLLAHEEPSPFQKICPLADCGNAFGRNAEPHDVTFMNTDLTVLLHREPIGEWLGSDSISYWETDGTGMADAQLFDHQGCVGRALQTLLLRQN
ncbi:MAG: thioesterase family protein, partial [Granulosicoccus sp.]